MFNTLVKFSIFILVNLITNKALELDTMRSEVSILVLVDLAHESAVQNRSPSTNLGFNPCFNGSCSRINGDGTEVGTIVVFQSLF